MTNRIHGFEINREPVYLTVWTGGYEPTSYKAHTTLEAAQTTLNEWAEDMDDETEQIELIRVNPDMTITLIERKA